MREFTSDDLMLMEQIMARRARDNFWLYRRYMNPEMRIGWFQRSICSELQKFYTAFYFGERPVLIIQAPPQHGKSTIIVDFVSWIIGRHPMLRTIYASFSDRLGVRANKTLVRTMESAKWPRVFPEVVIPPIGSIGTTRNAMLFEILGPKGPTGGSFRNTTVRGSVTGESLDLGVIDDPLKGRLEANSPAFRDGAWDWLTDDFFTRFSEFAALLFILTRWHVDDPAGRMLEYAPNTKVLSYPAIAIERNAENPSAPGDEREVGEALFPEHKSIEFLLKRKEIMTEDSWEALYQQSPFVRTGGMFPIDRFELIERAPAREDVVSAVRYWDKAGTKDGEGAETSGTLMYRLKNGRYAIVDVTHGRWGALEREERIKKCAIADGMWVKVYVEQEPGSGGKESAEGTIRNLAGFIIEADRPTGDKAIRAEPYAAQVQGRNVDYVRGEWNRPFLEEHQHFPFGKLKDMVDSSSGAFNKVTNSDYDMELLAA